MTKQILFLICGTLFFGSISPDFLQDLTLNSVVSIFKGPVFEVAEKIQNSVYDLQENYYWSTIPENKSFTEVARHEAAHSVVAHELGYKVIKIALTQTIVPVLHYITDKYNSVYCGVMYHDSYSKKTNKSFDDIINDNLLILIAGGLETKRKFDNSYGTYSDNYKITSEINYLKEQLLNSPYKVALEKTKNILAISKNYSDAKSNKMKNKLYKKTNKILDDNQEMIEKIVKALEEKKKENKYTIILSEEEIEEIFKLS
ncbi:MAG: hypothetical protein ACT6FE_08000 [Methanosarcinaceae archaeon]